MNLSPAGLRWPRPIPRSTKVPPVIEPLAVTPRMIIIDSPPAMNDGLLRTDPEHGDGAVGREPRKGRRLEEAAQILPLVVERRVDERSPLEPAILPYGENIQLIVVVPNHRGNGHEIPLDLLRLPAATIQLRRVPALPRAVIQTAIRGPEPKDLERLVGRGEEGRVALEVAAPRAPVVQPCAVAALDHDLVRPGALIAVGHDGDVAVYACRLWGRGDEAREMAVPYLA